jgi:hypothetical protein
LLLAGALAGEQDRGKDRAKRGPIPNGLKRRDMRKPMSG